MGSALARHYLVDQSQGSDRGGSYCKLCALFTLCYRLLGKKSLRRRGYAFLSISVSIRPTAPAGLSDIRALKQVLREHAPASWWRLRGTAKPNGSKHLLDAFKSAFGGTLGRLLTARCAKRERQNSYASYTRMRVHSFQLQGSASMPLAPIAAAMPDSNFSLRIDVARPTSSSSQRERGPQSPAQPCPLNIQRPSLSRSNLEHVNHKKQLKAKHQLNRRNSILQAAQAALAIKTHSAYVDRAPVFLSKNVPSRRAIL
jgi:hypothetical protein